MFLNDEVVFLTKPLSLVNTQKIFFQIIFKKDFSCFLRTKTQKHPLEYKSIKVASTSLVWIQTRRRKRHGYKGIGVRLARIIYAYINRNNMVLSPQI